jgi:PAS domain S-box-containing protein
MASKSRKQSPPSNKSQRKTRKKNTVNVDAPRANGLTVVGIGASAGGLKALQTFFEALPKDTGTAYVAVTQLEPENKGQLAELLQTQTATPISQATGLPLVESDHVYAIPPDQARDLFSRLFHANPIPTALTRLNDGLFIDVNDTFLRYYGLEREAVIGHTSAELNLPLAPNIRPGLVARVQKEGIIPNVQLEIDHPSGEKRTILASFQRIQLEGSDALISTSNDITARAHAEQQVRILASNLTAADQTERHRISRMLHDDLQQYIFAVKMQLTFLGEAVEKNDFEGLKLDLKQLDEWLTQAITTTRQLSIDLSPPILHGEGLAEALIWLASQMKEQYGLEVSVHTNGVNPGFEEDVRVLIFQSLRELLFNVVKHSGTLKASLTFEQSDGTARIIVSDDGKGFDSEALMGDRKTAHGLSRMRDRLFLLGSTLKVKSEPNKGTHITIEAPVKDMMD